MRKENLIPLTEIFLPGQRLMLVDGVFVPVGFGGNVTPGKTIVKDIGKGIYYKCTSVDTTTKKWAGNRAIQGDDGIWTFEDKVTQNLEYTGITPEKGGIYSYNALVKVKLWDGNISILPVGGQLWGYQNGEIISDNTLTATTTGTITADSNGRYTLGEGKYFELPENIMLGDSARTFVFQANLPEGYNIQFVDAGNQATSEMFGLLWGYDWEHVGYHFWSNDNSTWSYLPYGEHIIIFVYDGYVLTCYADGSIIGTHNTTLATKPNNRYRIGQYVIDDWYCSMEWQSKFCAVYDRALTAEEVATMTEYVRGL